MARGKFISLEGGEGVGKSTQLCALADLLRARGLEVVTTREPGGSPGAEVIRELLLTGDDSRWSPRAEALLFAAARADHVEKTICPALEAGKWVVSDRFLDSSLAYQGGAGALGLENIRQLHLFGSEGFLPDRTLVLMLAEGEGVRRADARDGGATDRIGRRRPDYHEAVDRAFRTIAAEEPARVRLIDAAGTPPEISARVAAELADLW
ncbi:MAG: dTMP kinase [Sphingomicrobium sp.]